MAHSLTPNIDTEVEKASLGVVDVLQVEFARGIERRWAMHDIPDGFFPALSPGGYEARVVSISTRTWSIGADDDSMTVVLGDADNAISDLARYYGLDIFEGARVRHHRLFPSIKEVYKDYWVGKGSTLAFEAETATWTVKFGFASLRQRALRKFERTCPHVFGGGLETDCPYDPERGYGVPKIDLFSQATIGTGGIRLLDSTPGVFRDVLPGHLVYNRTQNCVSRVVEVISQNELQLSQPVAGELPGSSASWNNTDRYGIGSPFHVCGKTPQACDARGMFGPNNRNPQGVMDGRKYFKGHNDVADVTFRGRTPEGNRFERKTLGNDSFDGEIIPVIFGNFKVFDIESIMHAAAGAFQHGLFIISEGEVADISDPRVNEREPDDADSGDISQAANETATAGRYVEARYASRDSFIKFGTHIVLDDRRCEDLRLTPSQALVVAKHVRENIGRRMSLGNWFGKTIDAYNWPDPNTGAIVISNPYLFVDGTGGGLSLHGLAAARIRIETQEDDDSILSGDFKILGLLTPLAEGMPNNSEDHGGRYDLPRRRTDIVAPLKPLKYTAYPNHIQAAYAFLTNPRWGGGLPVERLDVESFVRESSYCEESIAGAASSGVAEIAGTVSAIPSGVRVAGDIGANGFYIAQDQFTYSRNPNKEVIDPNRIAFAIVGRRITFNARSANKQTFSAMITGAFFYGDDAAGGLTSGNSPYDSDPHVDETTNPYNYGDPASGSYMSGYYIRIDGDIRPSLGSLLTISGSLYGSDKRFKANGVLADDITVVEMLETILDNCHGIYRVNNGKLEVIIKKQLASTEIDTVLDRRLFTDRGNMRNIIHNSGVSSIRVWTKSAEEVINEYSAEFPDADRDFKVSRVVVYDDDAQARAALRLGEKGARKKNSSNLKLTLTTNVDQSKRVLALKLREEIIQNLFCSFSTSLKGGMAVQPGDVIAVDSDAVVGLINNQILPDGVSFGDAFLFRVLEKQESDAYVIDFTCQLHVNGIYDDTLVDYGSLSAIQATMGQKAGLVRNIRIHPPVETIFVNQYGLSKSQIRVKVTYPEA